MPALSSHNVGLINSIMKDLNWGGASTKEQSLHQKEDLRSSPGQPANQLTCSMVNEEGLVTALSRVQGNGGWESHTGLWFMRRVSGLIPALASAQLTMTYLLIACMEAR